MLCTHVPVVKDLQALCGVLRQGGGLPEGIGFDEDSLKGWFGITNTVFEAVDGNLEFLDRESATKSNIDIEQYLLGT